MAVLSVLVLTILASCEKDHFKTHKVKFIAETSFGARLTKIAYTNETGDMNTTYFIDNRSSATEEQYIPWSVGVVNLQATGTGGSGSSSIKLQIWVDDQLVKEIVSTGMPLSASTSYSFK